MSVIEILVCQCRVPLAVECIHPLVLEKIDRLFTVWEDPIPKPTYLFALVAGDLGSVKSYFITKSGRKVRALGSKLEL